MKLILNKLNYYYEWKEWKTTIEYLTAGTFLLIWIELFVLLVSGHTVTKDVRNFTALATFLLAGIFFGIQIQDNILKKEFGLKQLRKPIRIKKRIKFWIKLHKQDMLEKLLLLSISLAIFLPIRLVYYNYVSHFFGANIGILSIITITMFVLIKYKKLGWIGEIFRKQTIKFTSRKWTRRLIIFGIGYMFFYGFQLYLINYAESENLDLFKSMMISLELYTGNYTKDGEVLSGGSNSYAFSLALINNPDVVKIYFIKNIPTTAFNMVAFGFLAFNNITGNWYSHYNALMFAEEGEGYLLFFFDRKMYRDGIRKGTSWKDLGMFEDIRKLKSFYRIKH